MSYIVLLSVFVASFLVHKAHTYDFCKCFIETPHDQNLYCSADFVIQVTVHSGKKNPGKIQVYSVDVEEVFKNNRPDIDLFGRNNLLTSDTLQDCGIVYLERGHTYVLSGIYKKTGNNYYPWLDVCKTMVWTTLPLTEYQIANLREGFQATCGTCKVDVCYSYPYDCREKNPVPGKCQVSILKSKCYSYYNICKKIGDKCQWEDEHEERVKGCTGLGMPFYLIGGRK